MDDTHRRETHTQTDTEPSELPPQESPYETCAASTGGKIPGRRRDTVSLGDDVTDQMALVPNAVSRHGGRMVACG